LFIDRVERKAADPQLHHLANQDEAIRASAAIRTKSR
jgi:hypothetical protein